jgi:putative addiction module component (TIGR02574 family)
MLGGPLERRAITEYDVCVTTVAQKVLEDALTLAPNDRAELAARLLESLDEHEADIEMAWAAEIERRAADARKNPNDDEDWRTALDAIEREVLSR